MGKVSAVIVAAGKGKRMGSKLGKQYMALLGKPVLCHCIEVFENCPCIDDIVLVVGSQERTYCETMLKPYGYQKISNIVAGGLERQHSVYNGLMVVEEDTEIVLVHDGARPFVTNSILEAGINAARTYGTGIVGVPSKDTIKVVNNEGYVVDTLDRSSLWMIQTPQVFSYPLILEAHKKAQAIGFIGTDDAVLVERAGQPVKMVMGSYENIKITTPEDMITGERILKSRQRDPDQYSE